MATFWSRKVKSKFKDSLEKAKNYAFLLLKFRPRSEKEIYQRLKRKRFDEKIIQETLSFLKDKNFLNDNYFARAWMESRLKKPFGIRRIKEELKLKGIDKEIIENSIKEVKENYSEEEVVRGVARQRFSKLKNLEPQKARQRLFAYLLRRGFSPEVVVDTINTLCTYAVKQD